MSKGSKEALTVLIVTHVIHVERVESGVCSFYTSSPQKYAVWVHNILTNNFLNIQRIFNPKKVLRSLDLGLSNHIIEFYVHWSMSKGSKVVFAAFILLALQNILYGFITFLLITFLIFNGFSIRKKFWEA